MYHIIVNPAAGKGFGPKIGAGIDKFLKSRGKSCKVFYTEKSLEAKSLASRVCDGGSQGIIGVGGDGTNQEIISGMLPFIIDGTAPPLGIFPGGSGNDFIKSLGLGKLKEQRIEGMVEKYLAGLLENKTRPVDIIRMNEMAYLNIANIGLDARIVQSAVGIKKFFKKNAYLVATLKCILRHKNTRIHIQFDGEEIESEYTLIAICNGQYYGGGMRISPQARIDDGLITVCCIKGMNKLKLFCLFPTLLLEKHEKLKEVSYIQCSKMVISMEPMQSVSLDGNIYDFKDKLEFKILPCALQLFDPA